MRAEKCADPSLGAKRACETSAKYAALIQQRMANAKHSNDEHYRRREYVGKNCSERYQQVCFVINCSDYQ
jgi:hypothetical protein